MTGVDWPRLLANLDNPSVGQLAEALAAALDISVGQAYDRVGDAVSAGDLIERDTGGTFPTVTVPDVQPSSRESHPPAPESESLVSEVTSDTGESTHLTDQDYRSANFTAPRADTYPPALLEREQWMGRKGKLPFAPWADRNAPAPCSKSGHDTAVDCECDARFKWGYEGLYADGETVALAEDDPRLDGRVFIQLDDDPFAFVDGDDVRCPETGEVHPAFVELLDRLGVTYADVSTSGSGVHAYYQGELPNGQSQAVFEIDTNPWGGNDTPPTVEIYAGKHVCVTTGAHVPGTPLSVAEWTDDGLRSVLEEYDALKETVEHDTDHEHEDLADYTPTATTPDETTDEIKDVLKAVDRLRPSDLPLRTSQVAKDTTGWEKWNPSTYRTSSGNDSLHRPPSESVFYDHKHGESFGVLSLYAAEEGTISRPWDRLVGEDWWEVIETAREAGAPIPEYVGERSDEAEHVAVFPPAVRDLSWATSGWDWQHAANQREDTLSIDDARQRTTDAIATAYQSGDRVLVEALPTMGKSYGSIKAAAGTGEQITVLTGRGHKEQYEQFREWCDEFELSHYTLPSFTRDCDTANSEFGQEWAETVRGWYSRGATPKEIHAQAEYVLGRPLPCQEHDGQRCPYASKWDFDPDDYDVLIGHYAHANKTKVTSGRVVVFDEFPDAYETTLGPSLPGSVSHWLQTTDGVPFDSLTDLLEHRDDQARRANALLWFDEHGIDTDETIVFDDPGAHAAAPLAVATLLASEGLGNGFEKARLEGVRSGVFNRNTGEVHLLQPPNLKYARGVVALDGTPTKEMWELSLGGRLNHRQVLQDEERTEYVRDALNLNLVRTTDAVKPYNSADHVNIDQDAALLEGIADQHGKRPALITTSTAEQEYETRGHLDLVTDTKHYGNVLGSNEFDDTRLGVVIGSNHYGDHYIQKWGAHAGERIERNDEKGAGLSYGSFGDQVLAHMREHDTLQAAMRFGRDGNGAVVYVHTDTLPEWVPLAGEGRVLSTWSAGMRDVLTALEDLDEATTAEIADHPAVDLSQRQVFTHLERLHERGVLARQQDPHDGRRLVWRNDALHRLGEHGDVDLESVTLDEPSDSEAPEVARTVSYTWDFRNLASPTRPSTGIEYPGGPEPSSATTHGGDRSPSDTD